MLWTDITLFFPQAAESVFMICLSGEDCRPLLRDDWSTKDFNLPQTCTQTQLLRLGELSAWAP